jgi:hypothetical protein
MFLSWWRRLLRRKFRTAVRGLRLERSRRVHPRVEVLEPRLAPATLTVTDGTDSATTPGTLGYVLAHAAAGDVIDFDPSVRTVTPQEDGLTIDNNQSILNDQGDGPVTIDLN